MAWKEYSELKTADKRHEDVRQKMIVCQSCLGYATQLLSSRNIFDDKLTAEEMGERLVDSRGLVMDLAGDLVDWVYEKSAEQPDQDEEKKSEEPHEPKLNAVKVLDAINEQCGLSKDEIRTKVLDVAERLRDDHKREYPVKMSSVDVFVKEIKGE